MTFAPSVRVKPIRPLSDMSLEEKDAVWFTDEECGAMESELRDVVLSIREASSPQNPNDEDTDCRSSTSLMGLENVCDDDAYEAHVARVEAGIESVLLEQGRQRSLRVSDEEALARAYAEATAESRLAARMRGVCYLIDDSEDCGRAAASPDDRDNIKNEINAQMAAAGATSSSFKRAERRGLARSGGQRRLREAPMGTLSLNISRPKGSGSHLTPGEEMGNASLSSFEMPLNKTRSTKSNRDERIKSSTKKMDATMKMSKNIRAVTARIALSGRCAVPSRPKSYVALGA